MPQRMGGQRLQLLHGRCRSGHSALGRELDTSTHGFQSGAKTGAPKVLILDDVEGSNPAFCPFFLGPKFGEDWFVRGQS